ncbi:MAG: sulfotransferase [Euryarchaeota archaeon]|nr:sulfotransferase [Euryarchaeota archaeon]
MRPVFIGGTGRSGTTVLGRILSLHHDIFTIPFETRFIVDPYGLNDLFYSLTEGWDQYHGHEAVTRFSELMDELYPSRLRYLYKIAAWKLLTRIHVAPPKYHITMDGKWKDEPYFDFRVQPFSAIISRPRFFELVNDFMKKIVVGEYSGYWQGYGTKIAPKMKIAGSFDSEKIMKYARELVVGIFEAAAEKHGAEIIAEHTPTNLNHARFLSNLFPEGKLIHIYRDPRDVVSSYKHQSWGGNSARDAVPIINHTLKKWALDREALPQNSYMEISLEELVSSTRDTLMRLCDFMGLEFDNNMLKMDLSRSHAGRWKKDLSKEEIALVERELGWFMREKGYAFSK